ncbi:LOW QUALITY PROTEIN: hypothetical protein HID58_062989, partial [Brassica napus]
MASDQLQVLNALDVAKTQWYHFTAIIIAGMGFFTDAYDLFCISLGRLSPGTLPPNVAAAVNGVAFCGTIVGQLFFGWLGDKLGRKKVYGMTLMVMVICSVASGLSFGHEPKAVMSTLCFFRFWLGFGIGAKFPAPAYADDALRSTVSQADFMPETARYTALVAKDVKQAASDMSRVLQVQIETEKQEVETKEFSLFPKEFMKRHGLHLLGTTSTWFLLDIAFFSQNLFQKDIYSAI